MIHGRLAVALGFSTAAHMGLAWMVNGQASLSAAPAQRALSVAMTPAAPRAVLNSIAPQAVAMLAPQVLQTLPAAMVPVVESRQTLPVAADAVPVETLEAPLLESRAAERELDAHTSRASVVPVTAAPSSMRISSARQRESVKKPMQLPVAPTAADRSRAVAASGAPAPAASRPAASGARGSGAEAESAQSVAGRPGANRAASPAAGNEPPVYPWTARAHGQQGRVVLSVWVGADGQPGRLAVLHSSGYPSLDRAAVEAVQHWQFQPARRGGRATESLVRVPVLFRLDDG